MMYSPLCGTNWVEWHGYVRSISSSMTMPQATAVELDYGRWAYSRQVYAPGTSTARGEIVVRGLDSAEAWAVICSRRCEFVEIPVR